jgi:hypothetical protein
MVTSSAPNRAWPRTHWAPARSCSTRRCPPTWSGGCWAPRPTPLSLSWRCPSPRHPAPALGGLYLSLGAVAGWELLGTAVTFAAIAMSTAAAFLAGTAQADVDFGLA